MPKTTKGGEPIEEELPSTLQRSGAKAQRTFTKAHDAAAEQYGSEQRAHRVAYSALKHSFEKVGDHWERKQQKGPSDKRAERGGLHNPIPSAEGVDAVKELMRRTCEEILAIEARCPNPDRVMQVNLQVVPLTKLSKSAKNTDKQGQKTSAHGKQGRKEKP